MLWFYGHLELIVAGIFVSGVGLHFLRRWRQRRRYLALRAAYAAALREARETHGDPEVVVRGVELHRAMMNSWMPGWFEGIGRCVVRWGKVCAVFTLVAYFVKGPIIRGEEKHALLLVPATAPRMLPSAHK